MCPPQGRRDSGAWREYCEHQEVKIAGRRTVAVDGLAYGAIRVEGWDGESLAVRSSVHIWAATARRAREIASAVRIDTGEVIRAILPDLVASEWVTVHLALLVQRHSDLSVTTRNGSISINSVSGRIAFVAQNGGITLSDIGGDVGGRTRNGTLHVDLRGDRWHGEGLHVETSNGRVIVDVPPRYDAQLEAEARRGRIAVEIPSTILHQTHRYVLAQLGAGGAPIRVATTNGSIVIRRALR